MGSEFNEGDEGGGCGEDELIRQFDNSAISQFGNVTIRQFSNSAM